LRGKAAAHTRQTKQCRSLEETGVRNRHVAHCDSAGASSSRQHRTDITSYSLEPRHTHGAGHGMPAVWSVARTADGACHASCARRLGEEGARMHSASRAATPRWPIRTVPGSRLVREGVRGRFQVWRELLIGASDDPEEAYMRKLIEKASLGIRNVENKVCCTRTLTGVSACPHGSCSSCGRPRPGTPAGC
jgi:hypothetical protein